MRRDVLSSPRLTELKKRRRKAIQKKVLLSMLGLLAILFLSVYLSRLDSLNINEVRIEGNKVTDTEKLQTAVMEKISEKYIGIFPKTNIFYYPQSAIRETLQNEFKRIQEVNLAIKENKILEISLTERTGKYIWCGDAPNIEKEKCYFSDESGFIFDEAPYFSGEVYFKLYGLSDLSAENPLGEYYLESGFIQLMAFKDALIDFGIKPVALYHNPEGDLEFFLTRGSSSSSKPRIILKADTDFQNAAENLKAALDTEPLYSKFKEKYSTLEYIDLRFGNKVYYKFR
jgi:hypothetical protein